MLWVWGESDLDTFISNAEAVRLDGIVEHIDVPFLVAPGENNRQIPLEYAHRSYEQAANSPRRQLRVFTTEEGATEHIGLDHLPHVGDVHRRLGGGHLRRARKRGAFQEARDKRGSIRQALESASP